MVDPYTSRVTRVAFEGTIQTKLEKIFGDNRKRSYEEQGEVFYPGKIFQMARGPAQTSNQIHNQVSVTEAPKKMQEEYLQLQFIPSLHSESIPVFEALLRRSNAVVQMSQLLPHLNLSILEVPKSYYMYISAGTGARLDFGNMYYHQSAAELHLNTVSKFNYLKDMNDVGPLNISGVDRGK